MFLIRVVARQRAVWLVVDLYVFKPGAIKELLMIQEIIASIGTQAAGDDDSIQGLRNGHIQLLDDGEPAKLRPSRRVETD